MISFISLFEIINVVHFAKSKGCVADRNIFSWIGASAVDATAVNPNDIKTLLGNFSVKNYKYKENPFFSNSPKSLPKNLPDYPVLCNWVLDTFKKLKNHL